mmetsp:Transcript_65824/g.116669  ORF Transcript_65824/g.116669 Transcript_65824/m.116669 type:complete len:243 (-) Transcript_65824:79-807(-)
MARRTLRRCGVCALLCLAAVSRSSLTWTTPTRRLQTSTFTGLQVPSSQLQKLERTSRQSRGGDAVLSKDLGGKVGEGLLVSLVAGLSVFAMSRLQLAIHKQVWVPPFGAIVLIFATQAVQEAKQGKSLDASSMLKVAAEAIVGVAGACALTVGTARLLGGSPSVLRALAVSFASLWMTFSPASFFPPAGALCALFVERVVAKGPLPGFEYALFPCSIGVALLLISTRVLASVLARLVGKSQA